MLTSLFNLNLPENASKIMKTVMKLTAFHFIDTDSVLTNIFGFRETMPFNSEVNSDGIEISTFANAGYDSSIFFMLLGPILFVVAFYAIYLMIKKLL